MLKVPSLYHNHDVYIVLFIFIIIYLKQKICIKKNDVVSWKPQGLVTSYFYPSTDNSRFFRVVSRGIKIIRNKPQWKNWKLYNPLLVVYDEPYLS